MKVKFLTNLGSRDADELHLDHTKCSCGAELDIGKTAVEFLSKRGIVEVLEKPVIKAVPAKPALAEVKPSAIQARKAVRKAADQKTIPPIEKEIKDA